MEDQGFLDIHGRPRRRTWTKLESTAAAGSSTLHLSEAVDWEAGDQLIVTSSSSNMFEIEEVVVASRAADDMSVELTAPLRNTHESSWYRVPGHEVDMRVEVGLLNRNIKIRGDDKSPSQLFGVHTIAAHGGTYRIENTEITHCGQAFVLGR